MSLARACTAEVKVRRTGAEESLKPATFMLWMRRYGVDGKPSKSSRLLSPTQARLGGSRDTSTLGGVGTSFNASIRTRLLADFDIHHGIELWYCSSSPTAWLSDSGRVASEVVASNLRSLAEIRREVERHGDPQYGEAVDANDAATRAREAFPWLPEAIKRKRSKVAKRAEARDITDGAASESDSPPTNSADAASGNTTPTDAT
ncbi:MAG: hypothetical protein QM516_05210 [Limnohabitans sp.]|nr:hypothetical protein [Limnohabitans sp.]